MLPLAIVLITAALVFYTAGVWAERRHGELRPGHAVAFALGLAFDAAGTFLMSRIAASGTHVAATPLASGLNTVMATTGAIALVLMAVHLAWAVLVLMRGDARAKARFHRFSVAVWGAWLVPYFTGMTAAMLPA